MIFRLQKGVASGGADQTVKFWNFELVDDPESETKVKVLSVLHSRTLKLEHTVLCVRIAPNNRFVAVALTDFTVKIFFMDSFKVIGFLNYKHLIILPKISSISVTKNDAILIRFGCFFPKFFVSLYGHNLPVTCMDISSDSTLIATGSNDKKMKIWGMDFGDCHKSIFAHDDHITGLSFVPKTHYVFTTGKDGKVKQWDVDNFQKIITLPVRSKESSTFNQLGKF